MNTAIIKPQWGPLTIALMVLGFVVWWPLGLAMLAYILWGEMFGGSSEKAEAWASKSKAWCRDQKFNHNNHRHNNWRQSSGNAAFDDYRAGGHSDRPACLRPWLTAETNVPGQTVSSAALPERQSRHRRTSQPPPEYS